MNALGSCLKRWSRMPGSVVLVGSLVRNAVVFSMWPTLDTSRLFFSFKRHAEKAGQRMSKNAISATAHNA